MPIDRPHPLPYRRRRSAGRSGFTLLEVLVTIGLLSIVVLPAMEAISMSLSISNTVRQRTEAASLAESKLNELIVTGEWQEGVLSGDFPPDLFGYDPVTWPGYTWEAIVDNWDQGNVQQLQLMVTWTRGSRQDSVLVSTLVYLNDASSTFGGGGTDAGGGAAP